MKFNSFIDNNYRKIIIVLLLLSIIPFAVLSIYDRPSADDYSYSLITHEAAITKGSLFDVLKAAVDTDISFYNSLNQSLLLYCLFLLLIQIF